MLPPLTQDRVLEAMPDGFRAYYENPNTSETESTPLSYRLQRYKESFENTSGETTAIMQPTAESMLRTSDTPLTQFLGYQGEDPDGDVEFAEVEGMRLYDEWTWTITATGQATASTPSGQAFTVRPGTRVRWLAFTLQNFFSSKHALDESGLYTHGGPMEIPVRPEIVSGGGDVSMEFDDTEQERRAFVVRFNYTLTRPIALQHAEFFGTEITAHA